jgi:hypothetical protein
MLAETRAIPVADIVLRWMFFSTAEIKPVRRGVEQGAFAGATANGGKIAAGFIIAVYRDQRTVNAGAAADALTLLISTTTAASPRHALSDRDGPCGDRPRILVREPAPFGHEASTLLESAPGPTREGIFPAMAEHQRCDIARRISAAGF